MKLTGIPVFPGIVFGKALKYEPYNPEISSFAADQIERLSGKVAAYEMAVTLALQELDDAARRLDEDDSDKIKILDAHQQILQDVAMDEDIRAALAEGQRVSAAITGVYGIYMSILKDAENAFTQARVLDMHDARNRLLRCLAGEPEKSLSSLPEPVIVVAKELYPSDTATIDRDNVLAIVNEIGNITSHTAIIARSYGIPTVLGVHGIMEELQSGQPLIVDACAGEVYLSATEAEINECRKRKKAFLEETKNTESYRDAVAQTLDGVRIHIELNISDAASVHEEDVRVSDGVGLLRSEYLYMEAQHLPDETMQMGFYRAALEKFAGKPVVLRTLDIGGDKNLPYLELPQEQNPFLGKRALRLCFEKTDLFHTQLRAALRASVHGDLWIMFPMVGSLEDWRQAKEAVRDAMAELKAEGLPYDPQIKLGIMIEIPSIALLADKVAHEVDFASIGTNDLCQYLMAADRMNEEVSAYYQVFNPAMFRILRHVTRAFAGAEKPIGICGEMGGDPRAAIVLVGLGIRALSMSASSVAQVKQVVNNMTIEEAQHIAERVCEMDTAAAVEAELTETVKTLSAQGRLERSEHA